MRRRRYTPHKRARKAPIFSEMLRRGYHGSISYYKGKFAHRLKVGKSYLASQGRKYALLWSQARTFFKR